MSDALHPAAETLEAGLDHLRKAPRAHGLLELIVRRPAVDQREVLEVGELDLVSGLVGDNWRNKPSSSTPDRSPHPGKQLTLMGSRVIALVAGDRPRWPLAGDQLYVDLDLSLANLPPGTRLALGSAVIEITPEPHTGCRKFVERFGVEAMKFVNSPLGRELCLRGVHARVIRPGTIRRGDAVRKLPPDPLAGPEEAR